MTSPQRKILVTSALPYANGPLHLGHMLEIIQTDIWVRFQRMHGASCYYVCASDAHGTPIMLSARAAGMSPEALSAKYAEQHVHNYAQFLVQLDYFHTTHSPENQTFVETIYAALNAGGHIARRDVRQAYDAQEGMFLPDRYVRGQCPNCGTADQYGDACENCSATYTPADLIEPVSAISGTTPELRDSEHLFFRLEHFTDYMREWLEGGRVHDGVRAKLLEWFDAGLKDWDISRDKPYFGFEVPDAPGKYFYVWLDAPVGYMASFKRLCDEQGLDFDEYWGADSDAELYHFIGKDIVYFHSLFWPAVLHGAGLRTPTAVNVHGFVTVDGEKMSKSRGTFITADDYCRFLNPEWLRYYYAARLGPGIDDLDLNLEDFVQRVNSDLVGKFVNIASRCAGFLSKRFDGMLSDVLPDTQLYQEFSEQGESIARAYEAREFSRAMRQIMALADRANQYVDEHKPWVLAKSPDTLAQVQPICTQGINLFRVLMVYLKPVLPGVAEAAEAFLGGQQLQWTDAATPLLGSQLETFKPLMMRIDRKQIDALVEAGADPTA